MLRRQRALQEVDLARNIEPSFGQIVDESAIRGEKVISGEGLERDPAKVIENAIYEFSLELINGEELQIDCTAVSIIVDDARNGRTDDSLNSKFFLKLAYKRLFRRFSRLDFAAWKLPLEFHGMPGGALANQHLVATQDEGCGHQSDGSRVLVFGSGRHVVYRHVLQFRRLV